MPVRASAGASPWPWPRREARVAAVGRTAAKVDNVAAEIAEVGGVAMALACDVSERLAVNDMVAAVVDGRRGARSTS